MSRRPGDLHFLLHPRLPIFFHDDGDNMMMIQIFYFHAISKHHDCYLAVTSLVRNWPR